MADALPLSHATQPLKQITIDYTPEACSHCSISDTITLTYDIRGGARWRTPTRFHSGTFSALIQCPGGDTNGLNFNLYLSSQEGDKSQDEIDFEFLGRDRTLVQTNFFCGGAGNNERIHHLGFDASEGFHEYAIEWGSDAIEWRVDGEVVRRDERKEGKAFPEKAMFLYASIWDASGIAGGKWCGKYSGADEPYVCVYKNIHVPVATAVDDE
ncbi:probable xyloglucan endotransglucosylase/hydrolase protein [Vigna radiata var. radiata]|uniref:Probable xyloglucan endotransglucosylase/hydrolase protein n=1 Tax=Vigna radiata var. radiata TaxID=3916 RepID=A0A1S3VVU5_VIGRR|nr:probable xyloglucan endotransglucosylase/hydrolase protein [Vigna radiata var. radiata]